MEKAFKIFYRVFYGLVLVIILFLLFAMFPIKGNYQIKIVKSGSMEPAIHTGAIVVIKPAKAYKDGDIITFGKDTKKEIPTTHRIISSRVESGVILFTTKGDANEDKDTREIKQNEIIGRVFFDVPLLGYIIDVARKPVGFVVLIIIPALIVLYDEGTKIFIEIKKMRKKKEEENNQIENKQI